MLMDKPSIQALLWPEPAIKVFADILISVDSLPALCLHFITVGFGLSVFRTCLQVVQLRVRRLLLPCHYPFIYARLKALS